MSASRGRIRLLALQTPPSKVRATTFLLVASRDTTRPVMAGGVGLTGVLGFAEDVVDVPLGVRLGTAEGASVGEAGEVAD